MGRLFKSHYKAMQPSGLRHRTANAALSTAVEFYRIRHWSSINNMHLLYLDDSGSVENAAEQHVVLGGICVRDRQVAHFTGELDRIASRLDPEQSDNVEFHASEIFSGRTHPWNLLTKDQRRQTIQEVLAVVSNAYESAKAFACVVDKGSAACGGRNPMEAAFEDLCSRFDRYLGRCEDKGLIILDESTHSTKLLELSRQFKRFGTRWGGIRNIIDGPMFVSSRAFRCIQVADHIAYSVFRRYEAKDTSYLDVVIRRFDSDGKTLHGLSHIQDNRADCMCPASMSRR